MVFVSLQFAVFALLVAAVHGSAIQGADYTSFSYGVNDPHTGDVKSQHETRVGDSVVGQYSLLDSDGTRRTVDYAADAHSGFNAVVRKDPALIAAPVAVAHAAPIAHAAPLAYAAAPIAHAAPLAYNAAPLGYAASPLAYAAAPLAHAAPLAYGAHAAAPLAYAGHGAYYGAQAAPLAYAGALGYNRYY